MPRLQKNYGIGLMASSIPTKEGVFRVLYTPKDLLYGHILIKDNPEMEPVTHHHERLQTSITHVKEL